MFKSLNKFFKKTSESNLVLTGEVDVKLTRKNRIDKILGAISIIMVLATGWFYLSTVQPFLFDKQSTMVLQKIDDTHKNFGGVVNSSAKIYNDIVVNNVYNPINTCAEKDLYNQKAANLNEINNFRNSLTSNLSSLQSNEVYIYGFYDEKNIQIISDYKKDLEKNQVQIQENLKKLEDLINFYDLRNTWVKGCLDLQNYENVTWRNTANEVCEATLQAGKDLEKNYFWDNDSNKVILENFQKHCQELPLSDNQEIWTLGWMSFYDPLMDYRVDNKNSIIEDLEKNLGDLNSFSQKSQDELLKNYEEKIQSPYPNFLLKYKF